MSVMSPAVAGALVDPPGAARTRTRPPALKPGVGLASAHHGELFQGQVVDREGRLRRCLVSLPCSEFWARAVFRPDETGTISVSPANKLKSKAAAERALTYLGLPRLGGSLIVTSNIVEGKGYGSSTSDCVASVRAVADAVERRFTPEELGRLVVDAETASDNTMFRTAVLFAQREGVVLEDYRQPMPAIEALGVDTNRSGIVDTLEYPPALYGPAERRVFEVLLGALRYAFQQSDIELLGRVATASAALNEQYLAKPLFPEVRRLAELTGAAGVAVAHSGTVLSVLVGRRSRTTERRVRLITSELRKLGFDQVLRFRTQSA